jgi:hypothetical protein
VNYTSEILPDGEGFTNRSWVVGNLEVTFGGFSHQLARTVLEEVVAPTGLPLMKINDSGRK